MQKRLYDAFDLELRLARKREADGDAASGWNHLERAHVLSQAYAVAHLRVHWLMFAFAWRRRDLRELLGQLPRLLLAAPGSWTGRAPLGNTGGSNVGIFTPMPVPTDLDKLIQS